MASRIRLLLLSRPGGFASDLLRYLETDLTFEVELETAAPAALAAMKAGRVDSLALNLDQFGFRQFHLIEQIRSLGYRFPVLVFADEIIKAASDLGGALSSVTIFSKKFINANRDLPGLMKRFFKPDVKHPVLQRQTDRHLTRQKAMVENLRTKNKFSALATNMSSKGAQLEYGAGALNLNDKIDIIIHLGNLAKTHVVQGHVAWLQVTPTGKRRAGIYFVKKRGRELRAI